MGAPPAEVVIFILLVARYALALIVRSYEAADGE
jgi:hypothetical protein